MRPYIIAVINIVSTSARQLSKALVVVLLTFLLNTRHLLIFPIGGWGTGVPEAYVM